LDTQDMGRLKNAFSKRYTPSFHPLKIAMIRMDK
jgi:hypothetical protein